MSDAIITVENLSKRYIIGHQAAKGDGLRHAIESAIRNPLGWLRSRGRQNASKREEFWALRDVSFEVKQGEVVGIIGRNGAGKSTLLKILSRITEPSKGRIHMRGRVASLLEVGTGFHPELTGRENIFLNGAILGMTRSEIKGKFDEIVAFSEVERFLDTPVKRYSSGMYVRLAFAVAAHLDPEILICDEVLAVGDATFQKKCLGKLQDVASSGKTVLFVSHNMAAISQLCSRAVLMRGGSIARDGDASEVVDLYLTSAKNVSSVWIRKKENDSDSEGTLLSIRVLSQNLQKVAVLPFDNEFQVEIRYEVERPVRDLRTLLRVTDAAGNIIFTSWNTDCADCHHEVCAKGVYKCTCSVPGKLLKPGDYTVCVAIHVPGIRVIDMQEGAVGFSISPSGYPLNLNRVGVITPFLTWKHDPLDFDDAQGSHCNGVDTGSVCMADGQKR